MIYLTKASKLLRNLNPDTDGSQQQMLSYFYKTSTQTCLFVIKSPTSNKFSDILMALNTAPLNKSIQFPATAIEISKPPKVATVIPARRKLVKTMMYHSVKDFLKSLFFPSPETQHPWLVIMLISSLICIKVFIFFFLFWWIGLPLFHCTKKTEHFVFWLVLDKLQMYN